ncbi:DUF2855 family protein [Undibacterium sp. Jales W-56]|uniref:DUF2855 family protein n=1 Tax=Undibacterium sp. Jales W-56 TaxID=2897325 RepID=UPI0021D21033|nr:DUF2855 family protein [Undibacterium sp. Jales W-56]MCU6435204.1 DUF2855 family protein [Undibacterium sp. Jales W-56]
MTTASHTHQARPALDFVVRKDDLHRYQFVEASVHAESPLAEGQILIRIDQFAFTSNNVTYAAFGETMHYWDFFPTSEGWGRIPVWGFGDVMQSRNDAIQAGQRYYGYFPMSDYVLMQPDRINENGFVDAAAHRQPLHPLYNQYLATAHDPGYIAARENEIALLRPLFMTSFMIDDFLDDNQFFGAGTVILSSASSKTAYGLAFLLAQRGLDQCEVIGLTSPANVAFTKGLGCYHRVIAYDQIESLSAERPVVYVDMSGNAKVRSTLHHHFHDNMKYSCAVGGTHWDQREGEGQLPGARPALFFAPAQIKKRAAEWGMAGVMSRYAAAWKKFLPSLGSWMSIIHDRGPRAVERVYVDMLEGRSRPEQGHILSMSE